MNSGPVILTAPSRLDSATQRMRQPIFRLGWVHLAVFLLAHIPLALLLKRLPMLSTAHALAAFCIGLAWAINGQRPIRVAYVGAYIAAAEVLWRMTGASVFWEFGKYGMSFLFIVSMIATRRFTPNWQPILYFLLLLPAALPTLLLDEWWSARRDVSFNLSGPFALMVAVLFFSGLKLRLSQVSILLTSLLAPLLGVASIAMSAVFGSSISFGASSNEAASGGFGPNQVSSAMGLGIIVAFLCLMDPKVPRMLKALFFCVILVLAGQSALTLSRSGLLIAAAGIVASAVFLVRSQRVRVQLVGGAVLLAVLFQFVVFPELDSFAGGAVSARFSNTSTTGRDKIMLVDLKIWTKNFVWGVGVGEAQMEREKYYKLIAAHNEITRMVAEHGLLGFGAVLLLLSMGWRHFCRARTPKGKALVSAMICFSFLFMLANGMRLAAVSLTFGLASVRVIRSRFMPPLVEFVAEEEPARAVAT